MQPNMDRGALLPYKSKDKGWVAPEVAYQLAKLLASPSVAMHGGNISPQEAIESANTLSGFMTPAGLLSKPSPAMARMNVYHGSPHTFDAFDASKIGTGEGAQAYGHGLYLAESPDVAKGYKDALSGLNPVVKGGKMDAGDHDFQTGVRSILSMVKSGRPFDEAKSLAVNDLEKLGFKHQVESLNKLKALKDGDITLPGSLYKVDLPDEMIARMLDWDKPLSQQPEAFKAAVSAREQKRMLPILEQRKATLAGLPPDAPNAAILKKQIAILEDEIKQAQPVPSMTGGDYFDYLQKRGMQPAEQAEWLRQAGIPGIRYLDQGSRTGGAGTSNFVVFPGEEHNLKILKRE